MHTFNIHNITVGNNHPFVLIAGPCQIESQSHALETAEQIKQITSKLGIKFVYKSIIDPYPEPQDLYSDPKPLDFLKRYTGY